MSRTSKFVYPYGPKISGCNEFFPEMDITDQRAPITTPQQALEQFLRPDLDTMLELESENIDDFDNDDVDYDYEDRGEYGEDVAMSTRADVATAARRLATRKKSIRTS